MAYDIFLSYSRTDSGVADRFYDVASKKGLSIWYDKLIPGGEDWRRGIVEALSDSQVLLVLFSEHSNSSGQLIKELSVADNLHKPVIPVLISDTQPRGAYLYEMASRHWINLNPDPLSRIDALVDQLLQQLHGQTKLASVQPVTSPQPVRQRQAQPPSPASATSDREVVAADWGGESGMVAQPLKDMWFPLKWYDLVVLPPILIANFILQVTGGAHPADGAYPASAFNVVVLLAYMLVIAVRNAKLNRSISSFKSYSSYLLVGILVLPFSLGAEWMGGMKQEYLSIAGGLTVIMFLVAAMANMLQVVLRPIFQRNVFKQMLGTPLERSGAKP